MAFLWVDNGNKTSIFFFPRWQDWNHSLTRNGPKPILFFSAKREKKKKNSSAKRKNQGIQMVGTKKVFAIQHQSKWCYFSFYNKGFFSSEKNLVLFPFVNPCFFYAEQEKKIRKSNGRCKKVLCHATAIKMTLL